MIAAITILAIFDLIGKSKGEHILGRPYRSMGGEMYWLYCSAQYADLQLVKSEIDSCIHLLISSDKIEDVSQLDPAVPFLVCVMENLGLIQEDRIVQAKFHSLSEFIFQKSTSGPRVLKDGLAYCMKKKYGENLSKENNWKSYTKFMKCFVGYLTKNCFHSSYLDYVDED